MSKDAIHNPFSAKRISHRMELPTRERVMKDVPEPIAEPLDHHILFPEDNLEQINIGALQSHFYNEGRLLIEDYLLIIGAATSLFAEEPNLLRIPCPVTVVGDTHGHYYDVLKIFNLGDLPSAPPLQQQQGGVKTDPNGCGETVKLTHTHLFLGDYVDRGYFSLELIVFLYALKIRYPKQLFLLRGNHECRHITEFFTFKNECLKKANQDVYESLLISFNALPIAALVANQFLCVHGGLSPSITSLSDIEAIDRFCEPPESGPLCDLLWADPADPFEPVDGARFTPNRTRGCSFTYTYNAVCEFLEKNNLCSIIRGHEAQDEGYRMYKKQEKNGFPSMINVFSAPNYLDCYNNRGAVIFYNGTDLVVRQFLSSKHPYYLPNMIDVFSWSMPFVIEKVKQFQLVLLQLIDDEEEDSDEDLLNDDYYLPEPDYKQFLSSPPVSDRFYFETKDSKLSVPFEIGSAPAALPAIPPSSQRLRRNSDSAPPEEKPALFPRQFSTPNPGLPVDPQKLSPELRRALVAKRNRQIKEKIRTVTRFITVFKSLRRGVETLRTVKPEEGEGDDELGAHLPTEKLITFSEAQKGDKMYLKRPIYEGSSEDEDMELVRHSKRRRNVVAEKGVFDGDSTPTSVSSHVYDDDADMNE